MKIATFAQHHTQAGQWARNWDEETDSQSDDYVIHEGTRDDLLIEAQRLENRSKTAGAGEDLYYWRQAAAIREAVE